MIPKRIHYCWFGGNSKPKLAEKCIKSWGKYCPDYEIIEWNEGNYDLSKAPLYVRQAYEAQKWAFVTDYVRLDVVHEYGGIYMDTDVELVKTLDSLLSHNAYFGFEDDTCIATGLGFGAVKGSGILKALMDDYQDIPFVKADGTFDTTPCPVRNMNAFLKYQLEQDGTYQILPGDILILPSIYLCPIDSDTKYRRFSSDTISIHWFDASWQSEEEHKNQTEFAKQHRMENAVRYIKDFLRIIMGDSVYLHIKKLVKRGCQQDAEN